MCFLYQETITGTKEILEKLPVYYYNALLKKNDIDFFNKIRYFILAVASQELTLMETYRSGHNEPDSKSGSPQGLVGSNPTVSATPERSPLCSGLFFVCDRNKPSNRSLAPPFSQKVSLGVLFSCKRPHDGSLSLPTFCELREVKSLLRKAENIFFIVLIQNKSTCKNRCFCFGNRK